MKDGRFESADELRAWLDRGPPMTVRCALCDGLQGAGKSDCANGWHVSGGNRDCPKCHGAGHYVVECSTPGWRMVDCECAK